MKSMRLPSVAIFFMIYFIGSRGGTSCPPLDTLLLITFEVRATQAHRKSPAAKIKFAASV